MPEISFHGLRHGVDIVTVSRRLGHASPEITLRIYAHLYKKDDGKAATVINADRNRVAKFTNVLR